MPSTRPPKLDIHTTELDPSRLPEHIAIIMDGNGRWARQQGRPRHEGHYHGYLALKKTVYAASDLGVKFLTVYGFSSENWRRPQEEVNGLMDLMADAMSDELDEIIDNGIRIRTCGRMHEVPPRTQEVFLGAQKRTKDYPGLTFTLAINYGGRAELVDAMRHIADLAAKGVLDPEDITEDLIGQNLYWPDVPHPDLLIRTAGEIRLSNFLLWETAYSELVFTPQLWPDFDADSLIASIAEYQKRTRRFGAVVE